MVRFWDTSAIVPLLIDEPTTGRMQEEYAADPAITVWWTTEIECASALARRRRLEPGQRAVEDAAETRLSLLGTAWTEVAPSNRIREAARSLVGVHDLRAADAFQLAAALAACEGHPQRFLFMALDRRLNEAARREGFRVVDLGM